MKVQYVKVTFETDEFAAKFPEIARMNLTESDKVRTALAFKPRQKTAGAPKGNKNAKGNKSRWQTGK